MTVQEIIRSINLLTLITVTLKDGSTVAGNLTGFDSVGLTLDTGPGNQSFEYHEVESVA